MMVPGPVISTTSYSSDWKELPVENWILVQVQNNPEVLRDLIGRRNKYFEDPTQRIQIMILYHRKFSKVRFGVLKISDPVLRKESYPTLKIPDPVLRKEFYLT